MHNYAGFSQRKVRSRGPDYAKILVVGEAPGETEDERLTAFVGSSGFELDRMLSEARIVSSSCRFTNAIRYRPQGNEVELAFCSSKSAAQSEGAVMVNGRWAKPVAAEGLRDLAEEIAAVNPAVIIAVGGTALWATTGKNGIEYWRGSELSCIHAPEIPVIPTYHPSAILRNWENRYLAVHDLRKANRVLDHGRTPAPAWNFLVRPSYQMVMQALDAAEAAGTLAVDIETRRQHITCMAIAWTKFDAVCIPFVDFVGGQFKDYWTEPEEWGIVDRVRRILTTHKIVGHNFHYDSQYFARRMLVVPDCAFDTLLAQHLLFPGTPKSLAHCSSLYCPYHVFWKDDGKEWDPEVHPPERLWTYNCTDVVKTFEVMEAQQALIEKYGMQWNMQWMMDVWPHILMTMLRGVRIDTGLRDQLADGLRRAITERQEWLDFVVGRPFNPKSPVHMKLFFGDEMGIKPRKGKKTKGVSFDKKALAEIGNKHILLWPIVQTIGEIRSLGVFLSTFAEASLDLDGRMRCSYNQGGTETFRESSSENAFGSGTNLQNIPSGNRSTTMAMPNMRKPFVPDAGMEIAEIDLAGADAQVVAWDAHDPDLKAAFKAGLKIHVVNNKAMYPHLCGPDGKAEPYYTRIKQGVHLTNYVGSARTMSATLDLPLKECEDFQMKWFDLHPAIPRWHRKREQELQTTKMVKNKFGFRRVFFDRPEKLLPAAVAWVPQSTIAIVANEIWKRLGSDPELRGLEVLLQVHDSLVFQYPIADRERILRRVKEVSKVVIPYEDPLVIPLGLKTSTVSWGDCKDCAWPE